MSDVVAAKARAIDSVRLVATVGSLDRLVQSGRVPGVAGWAADRLGVNPLFQFKGGSVQRLRPAFSREAALDRLLERWRHTTDQLAQSSGADLHVAAMHAEAEDEAVALLDRAAESGSGHHLPGRVQRGWSPTRPVSWACPGGGTREPSADGGLRARDQPKVRAGRGTNRSCVAA